jgi:TRAP-type mannitol/chloroaromatic compound transport system substrate-binding protein
MERNFSRRNLLRVGLGAAALAALSTPPNALGAAKYKWRMQTHWPTGVGYYKPLYEGFCNLVKQASGGQIEITPLPSGAIVPTKDVFEAVGRGVFEICWSFPAYWIGKVPVAGHFNGQPFGWENFEETLTYFYQMGGMDIIRKAYGEHGLYPLAPQAVSGITLYSKKPIKTIEDFKGLKVRSTGIVAEVFKKAGATPVFFPGEELYQALQTGVCDAAHWGSTSAGWDMRFQEVTKYIIKPFWPISPIVRFL